MKNQLLFFKFLSHILILFSLLVGCSTLPKNPTIISYLQEGKRAELEAMLNEETINAKDKDGQTLLHIVAKYNDIETVSLLIKKGVKIDSLDSEGKTPLLVALERRNVEVARLLASNNAELFKKDNFGSSPFFYAREVALLSNILNSKTINQKDENGKTPLHYAVEDYDVLLVKQILTLGVPSIGIKEDGSNLLTIAYHSPSKIEAAKIASLLLLAGVEPLYGDFKEFEQAVIKRNYGTRFNDGMTALHVAASKGYIGFVKHLIEQGCPVNAKNVANSTALHEAVRKGNTSCVSILLANGADPTITDSFGNTPLHIVMPKSSRLEIFNLLLSKGTNPNIKDSYGETPLHIAIRLKYNLDIIKLLVTKGVNIEEKNKRGETALLIAVQAEQSELVKYLAGLGANIHSSNSEGETPFIISFSKNFTTFTSLLNATNIYSKDSSGESVLHIAVRNNTKKEIVQYILENSTLINVVNMVGDSPLHIAVGFDNEILGDVLIEKNADIFILNDKGFSPLTLAIELGGKRGEWFFNKKTLTAKDENGNTALHIVCQRGYARVIKDMVNNGSDINAINNNNETPLFSALKGDSYHVIKILLTFAENRMMYISKRDFLGNSPLHICVKEKAYNSAKLLLSEANGNATFVNLSNQAGNTALHEAASFGDVSLIKLFLAYNADINVQDNTGKSPLSRAILSSRVEAARLLLLSGSSPVQQDMYGITPLHEAISMVQNIYDKNVHLQIVKMIRQAGGNPMARDSQGKTPFSMCLEKDVSLIDAVLGYDKFLSDSDGHTPLHLAILEGAKPMVFSFILTKGYPINKRDRQGETALFCAIDRLQVENSKLLFDSGADPFIANNTGENVITLVFKKREAFIEMLATSSLIKTDAIGDNILHYAARFANKRTIETLLSISKEGMNDKNTLGETPYQVALHWQKGDVANLFINKKETFTKTENTTKKEIPVVVEKKEEVSTERK
ncbi:MAG: ankyrin repeat domain-containing protein [Treponema sp.]